MNRVKQAVLATAAIAALAACDRKMDEDALQPVNVIDAANLTDVMLTSADPEAAVEFFRASLVDEPDRVDFQRGYAVSLARAGRNDEATIAFEELDEEGKLQPRDRLSYAQALLRLGEWDRTEAQLSLVPEARDNYRWNLLNALLSDNYGNWDEADRYYAAARGLTSQPTQILNNWGVSKMSRGDLEGAERHFTEAVRFDVRAFEPKNNLAIARGLQGNYSLPVISMTEEEKAQIYHNLALVALRQEETDIARGLLEQAIETHPRYFGSAADKLAALSSVVER